MINQTKKHINETQIWVIVISVILILTLTVGVLFFVIGQGKFRGESLEKQAIRDNVAAYEGGHTWVADALYDFGFAINKQKVKNVESAYKQYYYKELPSTAELAVATATIFLNNYYDDIAVDDRDATTTYILKSFVAAVGDPYSYYYSEDEYSEFLGSMSGSGTKVGIGVMLEANYQKNTMKVTTVLPGSAAEAAGILCGDYIVAVDGTRISEVGIDAAMALVAGEVGTIVEITVLRGDTEITFEATRIQLSDVSVVSEMLEGNIAYVQVIQFKENTPAQFKTAINNLKNQGAVGFIFDMRGNPGGVLEAVVEMIDYIVPDGHRIASYTIGQTSKTVYTSDDGHSLDLPIVVLCNSGTASAGELFTAAMSDFGDWNLLDVAIVGEQTYGKGVMQSSFPINGYEGLKLTMAFYNPPCDVNYDGVGVLDVSKPNHIFEPNLTEEDTQLKTAITELLKLVNGESNK